MSLRVITMARSVDLRLFLVVIAATATLVNSYSEIKWSQMNAVYSPYGYLSRLLSRFIDMPQSTTAARKAKWNAVSNNKYTTRWCKNNDFGLCLLYDMQGNLAGVCVALPWEVIKDRTCYKGPVEYFRRTEIKNENYYHSCFLLDSRENLMAGGRVLNSDDEIMGKANLHLPTLGKHGLSYTKVPRDVRELSDEWTRQKCVSKIGRTYSINMTEDHSCEQLYPWSILALKNEVIGVAFQIPGHAKKVNSKYTESNPKEGARFTAYSPPQCFENSIAACGTISIHMYFVKKQGVFPNPWDISCKKHDQEN